MKIELDKKGLIDLVNGTSPYYDLFNDSRIKLCGSYNDSYGTWSWKNYELKKLSEEQLYSLYKLCRNSWD